MITYTVCMYKCFVSNILIQRLLKTVKRKICQKNVNLIAQCTYTAISIVNMSDWVTPYSRREITYTVRGQSNVWRLPKYWPLTAPLGECVPSHRLWCGGRTHSLGGEEVGCQYFGRSQSPDTALYSTKVSTLWPYPTHWVSFSSIYRHTADAIATATTSFFKYHF